MGYMKRLTDDVLERESASGTVPSAEMNGVGKRTAQGHAAGRVLTLSNASYSPDAVPRLLMRPMSLFESGDSPGDVSLGALFDGRDEVSGTNPVDIERLAFLCCRGGWPETPGLDRRDALKYTKKLYFDAVTGKILRSGAARYPGKLKAFMASYARSTGTAAGCQTLADGCAESSVSLNTARSYVSALEDIYAVENLPAWKPVLGSRTALRTSPLRYFSDPSITALALGAVPDTLVKDTGTLGLLFETMCIRDLRVYADAIDGRVYHYRDKTDLECDAVVVLRDGRYGLIEIKLGGGSRVEEAENLKKLRARLDTRVMNEPSFLMAFTGIPKYAYRRLDGVFVVPLGCLRN